jgi:phosphopantothenoylcysteine decarboxylase/phosphopantothenate--cysteine ligase
MANDLVSTICLATPAPVAVVPAMNQQMYRNAATQHNLETLASRGLLIWGPDSGSQACGDVGPGRMLDPLTIVDMAAAHFSPVNDLQHLNIMITAGPTREPLDPVRYITNHSSGKMGFAIAAAAASGANVTLVSGPVSLPTPAFVKRIDVTTALEMEAAVQAHAQSQQIFIGCAAVADYRAETIAEAKIKKQGDELTLKMVKNPDIVAGVAALKSHRPYVVGFAAETNNVEEYARQKRTRKNLDLICANDVSLANKDLTATATHCTFSGRMEIKSYRLSARNSWANNYWTRSLPVMMKKSTLRFWTRVLASNSRCQPMPPPALPVLTCAPVSMTP